MGPGIEQAAPGIQRIRLGRVNSYLIESGEQAVLVDSGLPGHGPVLRRMLHRRGLRLQAVLLTHRHLDHAGGAASLCRETGARAVVHQGDAPAVRGQERLSPLRPGLDPVLGPVAAFLDRRVFRFRPCPDVEVAADGWQDLGFRLVHLPGHTPGHSGYLHLQSGTLFCGDAAMNGRAGLRPPSRLFTRDPRLARRSQERLAELDAPLYCFGHGRPLVSGARALRALAAAAG